MNKEFIDALEQVALERNVDKIELLNAFEEALQQAYERNVEPGKHIEVNIDGHTGEIEVLVVMRVVAEIEDEKQEISLEQAREEDPEVEIGEEMEFPVDPDKFTRIAVQTTKQVITQKIRESERRKVFDEYKDRKGEIVTANISRIDNKRNAFVDLGKGEAIMPPKEQIPNERYSVGMRVKVYIADVGMSSRGPSILVSRAAPELLEYLMRQEIPEVSDETVEIKSVAREAGQRSKVAVLSRNPNVDPIGACIGHKGSRIQAVTNELQRERVDIIPWEANPREFIRNSLSPAKVGTVDIKADSDVAKVTVSNDQLSLAIGKGGQNVRLAAKLTGYKIDLIATDHASDLDAAMQAAALGDNDPLVAATAADSAKRSAFDALFAPEKSPSEDASSEQVRQTAKQPSATALDSGDALEATLEATLKADKADKADKAEGEIKDGSSPADDAFSKAFAEQLEEFEASQKEAADRGYGIGESD